MEWLLVGNNESSLVLLFTVLGSFGTLLSGFGSLLLLHPSPVRKMLLALLILVGIAEVCLVGWGINQRLAKAAPTERNRLPKPRARPTSAPKTSPNEPDPQPEVTEEQAISSGVPFNM